VGRPRQRDSRSSTTIASSAAYRACFTLIQAQVSSRGPAASSARSGGVLVSPETAIFSVRWPARSCGPPVAVERQSAERETQQRSPMKRSPWDRRRPAGSDWAEVAHPASPQVEGARRHGRRSSDPEVVTRRNATTLRRSTMEQGDRSSRSCIPALRPALTSRCHQPHPVWARVIGPGGDAEPVTPGPPAAEDPRIERTDDVRSHPRDHRADAESFL